MMRNRWGVEIKKGNWVLAHHPRGGTIEGRIVSIERGGERRITLDTGYSIAPDDVTQTLGPMTVAKDGTVRQNPAPTNTVGFAKAIREDLILSIMLATGETRARAALHLKAAEKTSRDTGLPLAETLQLLKLTKNPKTRVTAKRGEITSPSQREHTNAFGVRTTTPSPRLIARRRKTAKAPMGVFANPLTAAQEKKFKTVYAVHKPGMPAHLAIAFFTKKTDAIESAREAANRTGQKLAVSPVAQYVG